MHKIKAGIVGATGFTGSELFRILHRHPEVEITAITSENMSGHGFSEVHSAFSGMTDIKLIPADEINGSDTDVLFLALPHGVSMEFVRKNSGENFRIIDLSGDFRLSGEDVYREWYNTPHLFPEGFSKAVFGLPEINRERVRPAKLVANPGCYPTSAILAIYPLLKEKLIEPSDIIVDAKSGATGAGVKPKSSTHFSTVNDNFRPYGLKNHRHTIEIQEILSRFCGVDALVQFTPHLLPVDRGIISTIYLRPCKGLTISRLYKVFQQYYHDKPFVRLRDACPSLKDVRGSNFCDIYFTIDERTHRILVVSAIDNLVKGAAGQAVQNMNLMFGLDETTGLDLVPVYP